MPSYVTGVIGRFSFSATWVLAAAIVTSGAGVFLLPTVKDDLTIAKQLGSLDGVGATLFVSLLSALVGIAMATLSTPLNQLLEGQRWPRWLQTLGVEKHRRKKRLLDHAKAKMDQRSHEGYDVEELEEGRILKQLARYPADEADIMPSRFGNALRAMETYGRDRYDMNSQDLWYELYAGATPAIQQEVTGSRVGVDFFVAMLYLAALYGLLALCLAIVRGYRDHVADLSLISQGVLALFLGPAFCYRVAVSATDYYGGTVRAMVNASRHQMATTFGLSMPDTIGEEQEMWRLLSDFVVEPSDDGVGERLDAFRVRQPAKAGGVQRAVRRSVAAAPITEPLTPPPGSPKVDRSTAIWILVICLCGIALEVTSMLVVPRLMSH